MKPNLSWMIVLVIGCSTAAAPELGRKQQQQAVADCLDGVCQCAELQPGQPCRTTGDGPYYIYVAQLQGAAGCQYQYKEDAIIAGASDIGVIVFYGDSCYCRPSDGNGACAITLGPRNSCVDTPEPDASNPIDCSTLPVCPDDGSPWQFPSANPPSQCGWF